MYLFNYAKNFLNEEKFVESTLEKIMRLLKNLKVVIMSDVMNNENSQTFEAKSHNSKKNFDRKNRSCKHCKKAHQNKNC